MAAKSDIGRRRERIDLVTKQWLRSTETKRDPKVSVKENRYPPGASLAGIMLAETVKGDGHAATMHGLPHRKCDDPIAGLMDDTYFHLARLSERLKGKKGQQQRIAQLVKEYDELLEIDPANKATKLAVVSDGALHDNEGPYEVADFLYRAAIACHISELVERTEDDWYRAFLELAEHDLIRTTRGHVRDFRDEGMRSPEDKAITLVQRRPAETGAKTRLPGTTRGLRLLRPRHGKQPAGAGTAEPTVGCLAAHVFLHDVEAALRQPLETEDEDRAVDNFIFASINEFKARGGFAVLLDRAEELWQQHVEDSRREFRYAWCGTTQLYLAGEGLSSSDYLDIYWGTPRTRPKPYLPGLTRCRVDNGFPAAEAARLMTEFHRSGRQYRIHTNTAYGRQAAAEMRALLPADAKLEVVPPPKRRNRQARSVRPRR